MGSKQGGMAAYADAEDLIDVLRSNLKSESIHRGALEVNGPKIGLPLPQLPDADMGFALDHHFLRANMRQSAVDYGDNFWTEVKLTMAHKTRQFALSIREVGESGNLLKYFFHMIVQGSFKKTAENYYDFQVLEHAAKWQGSDGTIFNDNGKSYAQFSGVVMQDCQDGYPVQITLVFKSKGLWDRLETRDACTKLSAVSHIEFGGWFLSKDAESTHVAG